MVRLSDIIESFIKELLEDSNKKELEIQRNELANHFSCAPSQINYVLTTRFTSSKGYYIESRRGGGGCIIIKKVEHDCNKTLAEELNDKIGENITFNSALSVLNGLYDAGIITEREHTIMKTALNDRTLKSSTEGKNKLRADLLKSFILVVLV